MVALLATETQTFAEGASVSWAKGVPNAEVMDG